MTPIFGDSLKTDMPLMVPVWAFWWIWESLHWNPICCEEPFDPIQQNTPQEIQRTFTHLRHGLFNSFVFMITQFFVILGTTPGGLFNWRWHMWNVDSDNNPLCCQSVKVLMERSNYMAHDHGQFLDISVAIPVIWLPGYIYGSSLKTSDFIPPALSLHC